MTRRDELRALAWLGDGWNAGPELPDHVLNVLTNLRHNGLVERRFGDHTERRVFLGNEARIRMTACWWFRVTPKGCALAESEQ